ncbi:metallophosphoesterase family protein [Algoriphagus machipongonensis]|uniref:Phosphoesterase, putative subfamily n=1 Tax=Algoriphagus machipongonensis TaxID=388413 RepID=A3HZC2_9BACT|nr:metallophosphoesterase family protein [Algoriphagus machipongonensis]EAZ80608.1 phosphoesterase, putative subfamily [Algoriphagus machipongonensis]
MPTKVALISDSHSYIDHKTLTYLDSVDEIWHAGDIGNLQVMESLPPGKQIRAVFGNIDDAEIQQEYPEWLDWEVDGVHALMTHIGGKPPRYAKGIKAKIKSVKPKIFICGHSHICKVEFDKELNCLYMNPGASGQHGFHIMRTMLLFDLDAGEIKNLRVVELGKRGKQKR